MFNDLVIGTTQEKLLHNIQDLLIRQNKLLEDLISKQTPKVDTVQPIQNEKYKPQNKGGKR